MSIYFNPSEFLKDITGEVLQQSFPNPANAYLLGMWT